MQGPPHLPHYNFNSPSLISNDWLNEINSIQIRDEVVLTKDRLEKLCDMASTDFSGVLS